MRGILVTALVLQAALGGHLQAQGSSPAKEPASEPAPVPFGIGERLRYKVKFGPLEVGEAEMRVLGVDTVAGHPTYHLRFDIEGGVVFYKLEDRQESWLDVYRLASRRFLQDLKEGDYERYREYQFDLENRVYRSSDGSTDSIPAKALDEASFVYFVRTVPLEVGETYEWHRYFKQERNPTILKVLRREEVEVPAGTFRTIVVRPIIKTGGIYSEGGEAEIYITDDERRLPILLKSKLKVGSLSLSLTEYVPGEPLTPAMLGANAN